jgi:hypothetical protein
MKLLILIFTVNLLQAKPFFSKSQIDCAKTENCMLTNYMRLDECEKEQGKKCYSASECSPFICTIQDVQVDDYSKPNYAAKTDVTPCRIYKDYIDPTTEEVQKDDCRLLVAYDEKEPTLCTDKTYYPLYAEKEKDVYEAYCTKLLGYEQKIEKRLLEDATLKAAKELKELEDAQAKAQKKAEKNEAKQAIEAAKGNIDKMSQQELAAIIEKLIILLEN